MILKQNYLLKILKNYKDLTDNMTHLNKENTLLLPRAKNTHTKIIYITYW